MTALAALNRARRAWEASQPQYVIEGLWDGLEDPSPTVRVSAQEAARTGRILEPTSPPHSPGRGLDPGAEPCRDLLGLTAQSLTAPPVEQTERLDSANGVAGGSAPLSTMSDDVR